MFDIQWYCNTGWDLDKYLTPKSKKVAIVANTFYTRLHELFYYDLRIFLETEPEEIIGNTKSFLVDNWEYFDYVLTFNDETLNLLPNARKFIFTVPWVTEWSNKEKRFKVSFLPGRKSFAMGHKLRHVIYRKQSRIQIPKNFIPSISFDNNLRREILFDSNQYNIAIENSRHRNYFTEKIVDCFLTKTIPIYWGCPNIDEYFDINGIIVVEKEFDFYSKINELTPEYYYSRLDSINANYEIAVKMFSGIGEQGGNLVNSTIDELILECFRKEIKE